MFSSDEAREVLANEYLAYRWGYRDEADLDRLLGSPLRVELGHSADYLAGVVGLRGSGGGEATFSEARRLEETLRKLPDLLGQIELPDADREILERAFRRPAEPEASPPATHVSAEYTVVGVFRESTSDEGRDLLRHDLFHSNLDLILPLDTARRLHDRQPDAAEIGYDSAMVYVDNERHLQATVESLEAMQFHTYSLLLFVEHIQRYTALVTGAMALLAGIALLVAALGITNTMVMSVLERTRQIGLLKAVGFRNRHVLLILLVESGLIGLAGGVLGVLGTWVGSYPGESIARAILTGELGREVEGSLFVVPWWLLVGVPAFTMLVTMLAGVYPARRAARLDPLAALRQE
jgi:putative ABC transport system permease protein